MGYVRKILISACPPGGRRALTVTELRVVQADCRQGSSGGTAQG